MLNKASFELVVQVAAGNAAHIHDDEYRNSGASLAPTAQSLYEQTDIILKVRLPQDSDIKQMKEGATLICLLHAWFHLPTVIVLAERNIRQFPLEFIPHTTRAQSMDV